MQGLLKTGSIATEFVAAEPTKFGIECGNLLAEVMKITSTNVEHAVVNGG